MKESFTPAFPTLIDALRERATMDATIHAYTFLHDDGHAESHLSYPGLLSAARAVAANLQELGRARERAVLIYPAGLEFLIGFFGCMLAGIVPVPVYPPRDPRSARRLAQIVSDCDAKIVMTAGDLTELIESQAPSLLGEHVRVLASDVVERSDESGYQTYEPAGDDLAFLQYTSGSTAFPKGVVVRHRHLTANLEMVRIAMSVRADDIFCGWLPVFHDLGLIAATLTPLWNGVPCIQLSPVAFLKEPMRWLRAMTRFRATFGGAPNFAFDLCARKLRPAEEKGLDLSSVRLLYNAAEPVRMSSMERFSRTFAPYGFRREAFIPSYGMAETTLIVSGGVCPTGPRTLWLDAVELGAGRVVLDASENGTPVVSCGKPVIATDIRIVNPGTCEPCDADEVGEIWIASPSVTDGYWEKPEETSAAFQARIVGKESDGKFLRTGDLGFLHNGDLFISGRLKDLIIVRGTNHYPQDIELTSQESHPSLRPGCVAAFATEDVDGEGLVLLQEVARDAGEISPDAVCAVIREAVASAHQLVPRSVVLLPSGTLLKTSSGKIQRRPSREAYESGQFQIVGAWHAPRGGAARSSRSEPVERKREVLKVAASNPRLQRDRLAIERWLRTWLANRLQIEVEDTDLDGHLSSFGLDSLGLAELVADVEHSYGIQISEQAAWSHSTVRLLSTYLARLRIEKAGTSKLAPIPPSIADTQGQKKLGVLEGSIVSFFMVQGPDVLGRVTPLFEWQEARRKLGIWPYSKAVHGHAGPVADVANDSGVLQHGINLASIDYLGLARHPKVVEAAHEAIDRFGVHSASTGILQGNSPVSLELESELCDMFSGRSALLFPTGWAAGFGSVSAFIRPEDYVLMDLLGHACLQTGSRYATRNVVQYGHLDGDHCRKLLQEIRSRDSKAGILVVTEGLYSMDSDWPDIARLQEICHEYGARLLIDIAHDISSFGPQGTGQIGVQDMLGKVDIVMGGFSKSLATNGGFLVLPTEEAKQYAKIFSGTHMFSSGLSPISASVALAAVRVSRSKDGDDRRARVMKNVDALRAAVRGHGMACMGDPSPIVPVLVGSEAVGRVASRLVAEAGVNASLIEYPAVPLGAARFRMQLTPDHTIEQMRQAAKVIADAIATAKAAVDSGRLPWEPETVETSKIRGLG